ncbi:hypothetical protein [Isoptericola sp. QY 916]|uniref:hypothetical protein n=1 Tax=Isoptericola sp. QY 916 TaxID=2782570 RepID=UPI003D2FFA4C|nr:hypothetical protein [Isoptericola sp. QY 916]
MDAGTPAQAVADITAARTAADLFAGAPAEATAARRARRTYRRLVALVHPDVAVGHGVAPDVAQRATARLNDLYEQWRLGAPARTAGPAAPHVVGRHDTYRLRDRLHRADLISTYATDDPLVRVMLSRTEDRGTDRLRAAARALATAGAAAFAPTPVDGGTTADRAWVAARLPDGLHTLREVRTAFPGGLDGRDWAWMARRVLLALDLAGEPAALDVDTVLVHPARHGVVLTGWGATTSDTGLAALFDALLDDRPDAARQRAWVRASASLDAGRRRTEYDLLLRHLYGARRYRPFALPGAA